MDFVPYSGETDASPGIPVEFVVLHYTAETLQDTLRIFSDPDGEAGAHLLISRTGVIHEITPCWNGRTFSAPHAGRSRWDDGEKVWKMFNDFSIGIEIVNWNGNHFPFTTEQYQALGLALRHLRGLYPALDDPARIVGHEQIAGWRGKVDPGALFDWQRLFEDVYPDREAPDRTPACPPSLLSRLEEVALGDPRNREDRARFWRAVSYFLEKSSETER
ncbi:MAG: N-acetylmuramoyl-L-alanine amidase [Acidobacteria bacterium]|nr:N-acetylmuramoyl-L-alanine amidase [Acidobacteriota bacterium]